MTIRSLILLSPCLPGAWPGVRLPGGRVRRIVRSGSPPAIPAGWPDPHRHPGHHDIGTRSQRRGERQVEVVVEDAVAHLFGLGDWDQYDDQVVMSPAKPVDVRRDRPGHGRG